MKMTNFELENHENSCCARNPLRARTPTPRHSAVAPGGRVLVLWRVPEAEQVAHEGLLEDEADDDLARAHVDP